MRLLSSFLAIVLGASIQSIAFGDVLTYEGGHGDIRYNPGLNGPQIEWNFDDTTSLRTSAGAFVTNPANYPASEVVASVSDGLKVSFQSTPSALAPTGLISGQSGEIWILPQSENPGHPFVGLSLEGIGGVGSGSYRLLAASTPPNGNFSLWTSNGLGNLNFFMTSANGIDPIQDSVELSLGAHAHFNWGFTQPGMYDLTLGLDGIRNGTPFAATPASFRFIVGNSTAIPEPSSAVLLASIGVVGLRRRRVLGL